MNKANAQLMRQWNRRLVLSLARRGGAVSQADIVRRSGLSPGTVLAITRQLRADKFLLPVGKGRSAGGRCPDLMRFNSAARLVVSAHVLAQETRIALVDLAGTMVGRTAFPTRPERGVAAFLRTFESKARALLRRQSIPGERVLARVLSVEGMVDARAGVLVNCMRLGWKDVPMQQLLESRLGGEVYVESDSRAAVLGESRFGAGTSVRNLVYAFLESGIGVSLMVDGRVFHGAHQVEGEIGHTVRDPHGPLCRCGRRGCLESLAAGPALIAAARAAGVPGMNPARGLRTEAESFARVVRMAEAGNRPARTILEKAARLLGQALADIINLVDPERVILAGYMTDGPSAYFFNQVREAAAAQHLHERRRKVEIVRSAMGYDAVLVGGAMRVFQDMFSLPDWKGAAPAPDCKTGEGQSAP